MLALAFLVIAVCVVVLIKANRVLSESGLGEEEPEYRDFQWPSREWARSRTEER